MCVKSPEVESASGVNEERAPVWTVVALGSYCLGGLLWLLFHEFFFSSCGVSTLYPDCRYNTHVWHWNNCLGSQNKMHPKLNYAFPVKKLFFTGPLKNLLLKETLYFPIWILLDTANMICLLIIIANQQHHYN
jgi:hypothetical protein